MGKWLELLKEHQTEKQPKDCSFEEVWLLYPRKRGKQSAMRNYVRIAEKHGKEHIMRCVERFAEESRDKDPQFIMHGDRFFSREYVDYLDENYALAIASPKGPKKEVVAVIAGYEDYLKKMQVLPYKEYLKTEHWTHFREQALIFFGHKCVVCNETTRPVHLHHKTYENRGRETFNDVIVLCEACHKLIHNVPNQ